MKKYFHIFFHFLTILLVSASIVACHSQRDDDEPYFWDGGLFLDLRVDVLDNPGAGKGLASRASETYFEFPVLDTEKLHTLRVIIFKTENNEVVYNDLNSLSTPGSAIGNLRYEVDFSTSYAIYLYGNEEGLTTDILNKIRNVEVGKSYTDGNPLDGIIFESNAQGILIDNTGEKETLIPMTEKFEVTTIARPQTAVQNTTVTMERRLFVTRTAVKFSFKVKSESCKGLKLKSITFNQLANKQYLLPRNTIYDPPKEPDPYTTIVSSETSASDGRIITSYSVPDDAVTHPYTFELSEPHALNAEDAEFELHPQLYFCESQYLNPYTVGVTLIGDDGYERVFTPAELPNLPKLPRNTHVVVNIDIKPSVVNFEVVLAPYRSCVLDPFFGLPDND